MASTTLLEKLHCLREQGSYVAVRSLQSEVDEFRFEPTKQKEYASMVFILAGAMSVARLDSIAIDYLTIAHGLHTSFATETHNPPLAQTNGIAKLTEFAQVCASLARAHSTVGGFDEAEKYFKQCISLYNTFDSHHSSCIMVLLERAQNFYFLAKHQEAIDIISLVLNRSEHSPTLFEIVWKSSLCPIFLVGQCYAALGLYSSAIGAFERARDKADTRKDQNMIACAELEYAIMLWVRTNYIAASRQSMAKSFRIDHFVGPALAPHVVEWQVVQLVASAIYAVANVPGSVGVCIQLNAEGEPVCVRKAQNDSPGLQEFLEMSWQRVPDRQLNVYKFPSCLTMSTRLGESDYKFECPVLPRPTPLLPNDSRPSNSVGAALASPLPLASGLSRFISAALTATQMQNGPTHRKKMLLVLTALNKTVQIACTNKLVNLESLTKFYLAFFLFHEGGESHQKNGVKAMHRFLDSQVNNNPDSSMCKWCRKSCDGMLKCEGCMVMRFCCKKHQKMSWRPPFGSIMVSHKKICHLLMMCKSFTRLVSQHGVEHDSTVAFSVTYKQAIKHFLQTDIFADYMQNKNLARDAYPEDSADYQA